jgi:hypothetical protein
VRHRLKLLSNSKIRNLVLTKVKKNVTAIFVVAFPFILLQLQKKKKRKKRSMFPREFVIIH